MKKIKVVIDTNVFISGIFWSGNSYKVLDLWRKGYLQNYTTLSILSEIADVLKEFRIKMSEESIYSWYKLIGENSVILHEDILFSSSFAIFSTNKKSVAKLFYSLSSKEFTVPETGEGQAALSAVLYKINIFCI
ncbi:MAG: putative toxin-antitoxin system toxin component, PIN family [Candidatus Hydrogenedentota bacterium]